MKTYGSQKGRMNNVKPRGLPIAHPPRYGTGANPSPQKVPFIPRQHGFVLLGGLIQGLLAVVALDP